jgi:hypothetical protein
MCRTERSWPPTFREKKTAAAGEPHAGKENTQGYTMPNAIHSWHICQIWPEIFQVNQNAKSICQTIGYKFLRLFCKIKNTKSIYKTVGDVLTCIFLLLIELTQ